MFFQGGLGPLAPPPLLDQGMQYFAVTKVRYEKKLSILTPHPLGIPKCIHCVWETTIVAIYPSLVLVQPMKTRPYTTERLLMGRNESKQKKNIFFQVLTTLGQIHCILPFALKLYLTCHLLITFANGLGPG